MGRGRRAPHLELPGVDAAPLARRSRVRRRPAAGGKAQAGWPLSRRVASEFGPVILQLFGVFLAATLLGWLCSLLRIPPVVGQIGAGVLLGNVFLLRETLHLDDLGLLEVLSELGVVFLIFTVGLETPFEEMKKVGGVSVLVAIAGVVLPFGAGYLLMTLMGEPTIQGLFLGTALVATSVGITASVLAEMGMLGRREARIILGAAVIDDVLGLTILTVVQGIGLSGGLDVSAVTLLILQALVFVSILMYFGGRVVRRVLGPDNPIADRWGWHRPKGPLFAIALAVCLGLSTLAAYIGLAAIIGAFVAGMAFAAAESRHDLVERFEGVVQFLVPFFFGFIGLNVNLAAAWSVLPFALAVTGIALATKVVGCGLGGLSLGSKSALAVGVGMMPRGEVGIIVASIGSNMAAISEELYAVVVIMSVLTTLVTPPILAWTFRRLPPEPLPPPRPPSPGHVH